MSKIRCPLCGHLCANRIEFGSHIRRCKEADGKFKFNPKHKQNRKKKRRRK